MSLKPIAPVLLTLACSWALMACERSSFAVVPRPSEGLLTPCPTVEPFLVPNPDHATAEQINVERVRVAEWGACNEDKFRDLSTWVREVLGQ